ncbi:nuclease [Streptomyces sp. NPDC002120]|uniref:nuclease n=1 Tax=Streptomyces sp. NPDC002120 TaxID=3364631 RepID=UPI0036C5932F
MPMLLIKGSYEIVGTQPDGDTVHFRPDKPEEWDFVCGPYRVKRNASGRGKLRLEGIDALETHYSRTGPEVAQPPPLPAKAREELLSWLGFTSVVWGADGKVASTTPASVPGFVLTRGADPSNRCIAFAGLGSHPADSGTHVFVDSALLQSTLNYHLVSEGLVYPLYYGTLFYGLRDELTLAFQQAQAAAKGVWAVDKTLSGATVTGLDSITDVGPTAEGMVLWPKLFRRLVDYLNLGDPDLSGFRAYLDQEADKFLVVSTGQVTTGLDEVVDVSGTTVKMTRPPEDLVFTEG